MGWCVFIGETLVAGYLLASLGLGVLFKSKADSIEGFLVANRSMGKWLLAFTFGATYFSSVVIVVGGMWGFLWGTWSLIIPVLNIVLGVLFTFHVIGKKITRLGSGRGTLTIPELIALVTGMRRMRLFLAAMSAVGLTLYAATVVTGASVMISAVLGTTIGESAVLMVGVITAYVVLSGMYGIVWTDALQGVVMALGVALLSTVALSNVIGDKGVTPIMETGLSSSFPGLDLLVDIAIVTSVAVWGLPQLLNRFYTVRDEATVHRAGWIALLFASVVTFGSYLAGIAGRSLLGDTIPAPKVIPALAGALLGTPGVALISAAIIAASMSTMDSIGLTVGSAVAYDIFGRRDVRSVRLISAAMMLGVLLIVLLEFSAPETLAQRLTSIFKLGWSITGIAFIPGVIGIALGRREEKRIMAGTFLGIVIVLVYFASGLIGVKLPLSNLSFTIALLASLAPILIPSNRS